MHSRICQIETHPVTEDDALNIGWNLDDIKPEIADYVDEDPNPSGTIAWLKKNLTARCGDAITILEDGFILHEGFREAYFQRSYEKFQTYLRKLENCSLADFAACGIGSPLLLRRHAGLSLVNMEGEQLWRMDLTSLVSLKCCTQSTPTACEARLWNFLLRL